MLFVIGYLNLLIIKITIERRAHIKNVITMLPNKKQKNQIPSNTFTSTLSQKNRKVTQKHTHTQTIFRKNETRSVNKNNMKWSRSGAQNDHRLKAKCIEKKKTFQN